MLWEHTPAATVPYLGLGAEISLVGYVLKTPPVGILDVPFYKKLKNVSTPSVRADYSSYFSREIQTLLYDHRNTTHTAMIQLEYSK